MSFYPFVLREISVLTELTLGHLRYHLTDVPPQPNSPPDTVFDTDQAGYTCNSANWPATWMALASTHLSNQKRAPVKEPSPPHRISKKTMRVVVFHCCYPVSPEVGGTDSSHLYYTKHVVSQSQTRVKLNRVFFPRWFCQARSLGCGFAR